MAKVHMMVDGSCLGNPGPGGYAAILSSGERSLILTGGELVTTNNRMEVRAVLEGLKALKGGPHTVIVTTDSKLVVGWLSGGWKRKAAATRELLAECDGLIAKHHVSFVLGDVAAAHDLAVAAARRMEGRHE